MSARPRGERPVWRGNNTRERYYCAVCNVWMGGDRQSKLLHDNGQKHREKTEQQLQQKRQEKQQQIKDAKLLQQSLQQMETAAMNSFRAGPSLVPLGTGSTAVAEAVVSSNVSPLNTISLSKKDEKNEWNRRKKQRVQESFIKKEDDIKIEPTVTNSNLSIAPDVGHYSQEINSQIVTFLEGPTFGQLLEPDLPVQVWVGPTATAAEQRLIQYDHCWKNAILLDVRKRKNRVMTNETSINSVLEETESLVVDLVYWKEVEVNEIENVKTELLETNQDAELSGGSIETKKLDFKTVDASNENNKDNRLSETPIATKEEEVLLKSVSLNRIRIILGSDEKLPDTLEEARLLAAGGQVQNIAQIHTANQTAVDESTGLSSWSTVQIKRTTVRQELREERMRQRQAKLQADQAAERVNKEREIRLMEEAKLAHADDSALGAYDVWNRCQEGYKGVVIHEDNDARVDIHDLAKKLATTEKVGFKKVSMMKSKKQNRRVTSADD